jgi:hypothetical protein
VCFLTIYEGLRALFGDEVVSEIILNKKTGQCFYRCEEGKLWLAISYQDKDDNVTTTVVEIPELEV